MSEQITPLSISPSIVIIIADIEKYIGRLEGVQFTKPSPKLRRKNRALSIRGSTGIEGNSYLKLFQRQPLAVIWQKVQKREF